MKIHEGRLKTTLGALLAAVGILITVAPAWGLISSISLP